MIMTAANTAGELCSARNTLQLERFWAWPFAGRDSPAMLSVAGELTRIFDSISLLHVSGTSAIFEVVDTLLTHECVLNSAKVDPDV